MNRNVSIEYHQKNKCRIVCETVILQAIRKKLQFKNPALRYSMYALPFNCIVSLTGVFPILSTTLIVRTIKQLYSTVSVKVDEKIKSIITDVNIQKINNIDFRIPNKNYIARDYQKEAVRAWLNQTNGIIHMSVGSGKSLCAYLLCKNINAKHILIVVPNVDLITQLYNDFLDYGSTKKDVQKFGSGHKEIGKQKIIIVNQQYLLLHKHELPKFQVLIIDEAHSCSSTNKIAKWIKTHDCPKFGMTGTMPSDGYSCHQLQGLLGQVVYTKKIRSLQKQNYISSIKIKPIHIKLNNPPHFPSDTYADIVKMYQYEKTFFEGSGVCANIIALIAEKLKSNTIIFTDRIKQVELIHSIAKRKIKDRDVHIVYGQTEKETRNEVKKLFADNDNILVIANSSVWGVGISIKNITNIIILGGYSAVRITQNIGRAVRLHKNKEFANIYDLSFNLKYSSKHQKKRLKLYEETFGKECIAKIKNINL
jgi:superfamily II DNA or RNA helicase